MSWRRCPSRGIPAERTPRAGSRRQQSRGIATAVNSPNVLRRRTQGRRRETRCRASSPQNGLGGGVQSPVLHDGQRGDPETRHGYTNASGRSYAQVDCETNTTVYEGGLDKRSSLDSLQQALLFQCS